MCIQFFSTSKLLFILLIHSQQPKARDTLGKSTLFFFLHALLDLVYLGGKLPFTLLHAFMIYERRMISDVCSYLCMYF